MERPSLVIGDIIFSSWSAKALAYAEEIGFEYSPVNFPLDYPIRIRRERVESVPPELIVKDFCTGCRCEASFFERYVQPKLPFRAPSAVQRVPILIQASGAVYFDLIAIAAAMYETTTGDSLVGSAGQAFSLFVSCQTDFPQLIHDLSYSQSFRPSGERPQLTTKGEKELGELLELFEYYARHKSSLSQPGQTIFEVGILNFAHAIVRASNLAIPKLVRELLEQCLSRSGPKRVVESATSVYRRIQPRPSSFAGIAAWYRKHPELPLIHNWQADTFHYLENDVAEDLFDLAANNLSDEDLITRVAAEYETEKTQVAEDARTFFATINPTRPVGGEFRLDRVPLGGR